MRPTELKGTWVRLTAGKSQSWVSQSDSKSYPCQLETSWWDYALRIQTCRRIVIGSREPGSLVEEVVYAKHHYLAGWYKVRNVPLLASDSSGANQRVDRDNLQVHLRSHLWFLKWSVSVIFSVHFLSSDWSSALALFEPWCSCKEGWINGQDILW